MKQTIIAILLTVWTLTARSQDFPSAPNQLVNDYTGTLSSSQTNQLERKLVAFSDSSSVQISIAIIKSVGGYDINEYALELGRKWGVGDAKKNSGIMIVVALGDRKISIQTGYGLEGALPDVYAKRIIENEIKPHFKAGDYYTGLDAGTDAIIKYTKGEYTGEKPKSKKANGTSAVFVLLIILVVVILILKKGGRGNGGRQVIGGRGVADALFWSALLGSGRSSRGGWGGGSGGGSGGFGGFGGGSFGGGGSSGSW